MQHVNHLNHRKNLHRVVSRMYDTLATLGLAIFGFLLAATALLQIVLHPSVPVGLVGAAIIVFSLWPIDAGLGEYEAMRKRRELRKEQSEVEEYDLEDFDF